MFNDLRYRLRAIFRRGEMERDLATELQRHYEREINKLVERGLTPSKARRQARLAMGGIEHDTFTWLMTQTSSRSTLRCSLHWAFAARSLVGS